MILNNFAPIGRNNKKFIPEPALKNEGNAAWLERAIRDNKFTREGLLLIGGASIPDFHIRVAQSHLRYDLTPSYWSMVGILTGTGTFFSVPLQWTGPLAEMPHANAVQECSMADYDDPEWFPNIAFIQFTKDMKKILDFARDLKWKRSLIDLPELVVRWLEYVWAVGQAGNPLANAKGLPSAVFAEAAFGMGGIELTPGLATASSCPEAIWQAAKWWSAYYEKTGKLKIKSQAASMVPAGRFLMRQPSAAVHKQAYEEKPKV